MNSDGSSNTDELNDKLKRWLGEQGYPTEFRAANICRKHKFWVRQGYHVKHDSNETPREIDVVAIRDHPIRDAPRRNSSISGDCR